MINFLENKLKIGKTQIQFKCQIEDWLDILEISKILQFTSPKNFLRILLKISWLFSNQSCFPIHIISQRVRMTWKSGWSSKSLFFLYPHPSEYPSPIFLCWSWLNWKMMITLFVHFSLVSIWFWNRHTQKKIRRFLFHFSDSHKKNIIQYRTIHRRVFEHQQNHHHYG